MRPQIAPPLFTATHQSSTPKILIITDPHVTTDRRPENLYLTTHDTPTILKIGPEKKVPRNKQNQEIGNIGEIRVDCCL